MKINFAQNSGAAIPTGRERTIQPLSANNDFQLKFLIANTIDGMAHARNWLK